jgi:hypothetical protein
VGCKRPTGENSHVRTWGNTFFAALSLHSTTRRYRGRTRARACGSECNTTPAESCAARASKCKLSPAHARQPPSLGPQLNWNEMRHVDACAAQGSYSLSFNCEAQVLDSSCVAHVRGHRGRIPPFGVGPLGLGKVNCHVHLPPSR